MQIINTNRSEYTYNNQKIHEYVYTYIYTYIHTRVSFVDLPRPSSTESPSQIHKGPKVTPTPKQLSGPSSFGREDCLQDQRGLPAQPVRLPCLLSIVWGLCAEPQDACEPYLEAQGT